MTQLLGYICSNSSLTAHAVNTVRREAWPEQATPWAATGFGWIQESRTLLRKHPHHGAPVDMLGLMADVSARSLVGHMSQNTNGGVDSLDLQPFRFRKWVYAQTGKIPQFESYRSDMLAETPDYLRRGVRGNTAAELLFLRFYHHMCENGALARGGVHGELIASALAETLSEAQRYRASQDEESLGLNIVAATERFLIAARTGPAMHMRLFKGMKHPAEEPLFAGHRPKTVEHPKFRAAFLASGLQPTQGDWRELAPQTITWVDPTWQTQVLPF
ncbi:class II glutamine amidotransferase [Bradymonas sediminis]|uniref:Uncharacterized protein n=1 Tax=Bradymonas sediminis TaxID=1548548 RepID=A0A2Z4FFW4_9DELT|nr:hypothetical protein [Bradymonas sediminis]AWV87802.1 hypothetical protein DN745_00015 [Bradymonas sediminis]TDP73896.1 glutamine amidotransferase [Bradymonas sediminis]